MTRLKGGGYDWPTLIEEGAAELLIIMKIEFTKEVIFKDMHGTILKVYAVGDQVDYTAKAGHYWVTSMGGIYFVVAREIK